MKKHLGRLLCNNCHSSEVYFERFTVEPEKPGYYCQDCGEQVQLNKKYRRRNNA
jgi:transposase-like protein